MPNVTRSLRSWAILLPVLLLSATGAALGFWKATAYDLTPGLPASPTTQWPTTADLPRNPNTATLVVTVHPSCPCSRATLQELSVLMTHHRDRLTAYVLFERPAGFITPWEQTSLWNNALITGVTRVPDESHLGVQTFGARTSGQVLLYDAAGHLRFSGGITSSRGHMGDNLGLRAIMAFLESGAIPVPETPVYGCAL